ncbi:MAG: hypothetical protein J0L81_02275 [Caulobacterales bacterium]|nr:hypothetical protein [Caulobacterales bacterium]
MARKAGDSARGKLPRETGGQGIPVFRAGDAGEPRPKGRAFNEPLKAVFTPAGPGGFAPGEIERQYRKLSGKPSPISRSPSTSEEQPNPVQNAFKISAEWAQKIPIGESVVEFGHESALRERREWSLRLFLLLQTNLTDDESKNSASLNGISEILRDLMEPMDERGRTKTIAVLMGYISELQTAGVLEATPSDRLARVAMLIGEAAALVKVPVPLLPRDVPKFENRVRDPVTLKRVNAIEWYDQQWKPLVDAGAAAGDDIRREDMRFYSALAGLLKARGKKISDVLPPSPTRGRKPGTDEERLKASRERNALAARRKRLQPE